MVPFADFNVAEGIGAILGRRRETKPLANQSDEPRREQRTLCQQARSDVPRPKARKNRIEPVSPIRYFPYGTLYFSVVVVGASPEPSYFLSYIGVRLGE